MSKKNTRTAQRSLPETTLSYDIPAAKPLSFHESTAAEATEYGGRSFSDGVKQGRISEKRNISINLAIMEMDIDLIAQAVGVDIDTARSWLEFYKEYN